MSNDGRDEPERPASSAVRVGLRLGGIVLAAVVVFGLGVMEGSRVTESVALSPAPPAAPPPETFQPPPSALAATGSPIPPDKLTFYDRLSGVAPAAPLAPPEERSPASVPVTPVQAPQSFPSRPPAAAAAPVPDPSASSSESPKKPSPAATVVATKTAPAPKTDTAAKIRKLSGKGHFAVQVAAASDRAAAAETAAFVKRNGFEAVTVMASVKGKVWYRIRVGTFPSKQAATQAAGLFKSGFGLNAVAVEN